MGGAASCSCSVNEALGSIDCGVSGSGSHGGSSPCDDDGQSQTTEGSPIVGGILSGVVGASAYVNGVFTEDSDPESWELSDMVKCRGGKAWLCSISRKIFDLLRTQLLKTHKELSWLNKPLPRVVRAYAGHTAMCPLVLPLFPCI